jgi:hypothetical protein
MTIENRELAPGTKLEGTHKKTTYTCEVVQTAEGETRFQLEDGRLFSSPSAAGKAVMNGISCNGWRFWSLVGEATVAIKAPNRAATVEKPTTPKAKLQIKKLPNQRTVAPGQVRWFCSACMKSFLLPAGEEPAACPEGHPWAVEHADQDDSSIN